MTISISGDGSITRTGGTDMTGTNTNDNAAAGEIGEYVSSEVLVGSAVALSTGVASNITSISLTAGDWDLHGVVVLNPAGTTTVSAPLIGWISTTSASLPTYPNKGAVVGTNFSYATGSPQALPVGNMRLSLAATTTVYLSIYAVFGVSTCSAYGFIGARRVR